MTARRPLPPELGQVFSLAQAKELGTSTDRLRAKDLSSPFSGVRVRVRVQVLAPPEADTDPLAIDRAERHRVRALIGAYAVVMRPHAFVAGRSALVWHGAAVPHGDSLDIAVLKPERAPRRVGIRGRVIAPHLVNTQILDGVRVASPASAWAMLAGELGIGELVRVGDQLVRIPRDSFATPRPEGQLATLDQLRNVVDAGRRPGIGDLREALELIRIGSMSPLETDARLDLVAAGVPEPELDVAIRTSHGALIGVADGAWRDFGVLLEVEGDHHRTSSKQWQRDIDKHAAYFAAGWEVVRLTAAHIRGPHPSAVARVSDALSRHGATLPPLA